MPELTAQKMKQLLPRLGKESDSSLGREFNVTRQRLAQIRNDKNIPAFNFEFRKEHKTTVGVCITKADKRDMGKAMKITDEKSKSEYMRGAIRDKNRKVLESG